MALFGFESSRSGQVGQASGFLLFILVVIVIVEEGRRRHTTLGEVLVRGLILSTISV